MMRKHAIWMILLLSLTVKICLTLFVFNNNPDGLWGADSSSYWNPALSILKTHTFSVSPDQVGSPETIRTPGYPFFLFLIMKSFSKSVAAVIWIQVVMSLISIYFAYRIGELVFGSKAGILAGVFAALDLTAIASCNMILTEILFDFLLILGVWFVLKWLLQKKQGSLPYLWLFIACCCFSAATLVRPVLYFFFPVFWIFCFIWGVNNWPGTKQFTLMMMIVIVPAVIVIGGWQARNGYLTENAGISSIQGTNLLYYRGAGVYAMKKGISIEKARVMLKQDFFDKYPQMIGMPAAMRSQLETREGISIILKYPFIYAKVHFRGSLNMILNPGSFRIMNLLGFDFEKGADLSLHDRFFKLGFIKFLGYLIKNQTLLLSTLVVGGAILGCFYLFSLAGFIKTGSGLFSFAHAFILSVIVYLLLISGGPEAHDRFREPIMPLLSIYAGHGACLLINLLPKREKGY
jgi:hypothetical protein